MNEIVEFVKKEKKKKKMGNSIMKETLQKTTPAFFKLHWRIIDG